MLAVCIAQAQLFADGNKRTAYGAVITFCEFNGYTFLGDSKDLAIFLEMQAYASMVRDYGDDPRDKALQALAIWLSWTVHPNDIDTP